MQYLTVFLVWLSFVSCQSTSDVLEFGDNDFDDGMKSLDTVLVMFYAPWCGHCKKMKPEFEQAAPKLKGNDPPIHLAKVDCTEDGKDTCGKFGVSGYPTLKIFKGGVLSSIEYAGERTSAGIVRFMTSQVGPASKKLTSKSELDKFLSTPEVSVVGFFAESSNMHGAFDKASDKLRQKYRFAHSFDADLRKEHGDEHVVLFRPKQLKNTFEKDFVSTDQTDDIQKFIADNYHGLTGVRTSENVADFKEPFIVAYYKVDYVKNAKGTNYWRNRVMKVAKDHDGLTFAISNHQDFQHELEEFGHGFTDGDKPVVLARGVNKKKYVMDTVFSVDNLEQFATDLMADKLTPFLKSESEPSSNDGPVKIATARNFDELVTDDKNSLVEFYAPWCGHCKKLTPIYEELGEKMKDESEVMIVKMDATANDVPAGFDVKGFPTIYFVPKGSKNKPVVYNGGRDVNSFVKYLAKEATDELTGFDRKGNPIKTEL